MTENANLDNFDNVDYSPLSGGLFHRLLTSAGLAQPGQAGVRLRVRMLVCATYVPILILSAVQGVACNSALRVPFLFDFAELCRFLLVGPLLIVSEVIVEPWLVQVVKHTKDRLISNEDMPNYERLIAGAARWRDSFLAEILLLISTFGWQWIEVHVVPLTATTTWHQQPTSNAPTLAWFWYAYFAKPLIRFLWLRWLWRYVIWSVLLVRTASLKLRIMSTHPDRHGGLAFIAVGHARFAVLAFALGVQAASIFGMQIIFEGQALMSLKYEIVGVLALVLVVFLSPLLAYTANLLDAKRIGLFEYGVLADEYTSQFHAKWILGRGDEPLLGAADIQSLSDLGNSYSVVEQMRPCLISKSNLMVFALATLLPMLPLLLTVYPFDQLLNHLLKAIL